MEQLQRVFNDEIALGAYLSSVAAFLRDLNAFAAQKRSSVMIEYNVGGVISVVKKLETMGNKSGDAQLLTDAWFIREDGRSVKKEAHTTDYYNSAYDKSATLGIAVAQLLVALGLYVDSNTAQMLKAAASLLRRYCGYLQTGTEHEAVFEDETGDEHLSLARFFRSAYQLKVITDRSNLVRSQELRNEGNLVFKQGKFGSAIAKYTEALILDPQNYIIYSNRAACYTYLNAVENAITDLLKSIELNSKFQPSWARLGYCYLAKGNAIQSVKAYVKAIELANEQELLPQFIQKLVESLIYAEQRARSQGASPSELHSLTQHISHVRSRAQPSPGGNGGIGGVGGSNTGNFSTGDANNANRGNVNPGSTANTNATGHRTPTPPVTEGGTQIPFRFPGMLFSGVSDGNASETQGNFPIFTSGNQTDAVRQALNYMVDAFGINVQPTVPDLNTQANAQQQGPSIATDQAGVSQDEVMDDPETSVPPEQEQQPQQQQQQQQQQPNHQHRSIPQNIQDIFLNSLPNALGPTVGPIIVQSLTNALNAGHSGQGATYTTVNITPEQMEETGEGQTPQTQQAQNQPPAPTPTQSQSVHHQHSTNVNNDLLSGNGTERAESATTLSGSSVSEVTASGSGGNRGFDDLNDDMSMDFD